MFEDYADMVLRNAKMLAGIELVVKGETPEEKAGALFAAPIDHGLSESVESENPAPITVSANVRQGLEAVRQSGATNMLDRTAVLKIADFWASARQRDGLSTTTVRMPKGSSRDSRSTRKKENSEFRSGRHHTRPKAASRRRVGPPHLAVHPAPGVERAPLEVQSETPCLRLGQLKWDCQPSHGRGDSMLGKRSDQRGLFEADHLYRDLVGRDSFYGQLGGLRGQLFRDEDFAALYCRETMDGAAYCPACWPQPCYCRHMTG